MSTRFVAHVRVPNDALADLIDCDTAHVDEHGYLHLDSANGARTCYQSTAWLKYTLEPAPQDSTGDCAQPDPAIRDYTEAVNQTCTIGQFRKLIGLPPMPVADSTPLAPCSDQAPGPGQQAPQPTDGDLVHIHRAGGCYPGRVYQIYETRLLLDVDWMNGQYLTVEQDESRQIHGSWHWPCNGDEPAEAEPEPPAPTVINITVQGSIVSERDLLAAIDKAAVQRGLRTPGYIPR